MDSSARGSRKSLNSHSQFRQTLRSARGSQNVVYLSSPTLTTATRRLVLISLSFFFDSVSQLVALDTAISVLKTDVQNLFSHTSKPHNRHNCHGIIRHCRPTKLSTKRLASPTRVSLRLFPAAPCHIFLLRAIQFPPYRPWLWAATQTGRSLALYTPRCLVHRQVTRLR